jgi:hypothetical protein
MAGHDWRKVTHTDVCRLLCLVRILAQLIGSKEDYSRLDV